MAYNMRTSQIGIDLIKTFEGFRPRCEKLNEDEWIIGYGHVRSSEDNARIGEAEADSILREYDLPPVERLIGYTVLAPLNQNEFDALVSLAFNIGADAFESSDLVVHLNGGNRLHAAESFNDWCHARIGGRVQLVDALVRRRASEKALFLEVIGAMPSASSRIIHPLSTVPQLSAGKSNFALPHDRQQSVANGKMNTDATGSFQPLNAKDIPDTEDTSYYGDASLDSDEDMPEAERVEEPSAEDITHAISELVNNDADGQVTKSVWPERDSLRMPGDTLPNAAETHSETHHSDTHIEEAMEDDVEDAQTADTIIEDDNIEDDTDNTEDFIIEFHSAETTEIALTDLNDTAFLDEDDTLNAETEISDIDDADFEDGSTVSEADTPSDIDAAPKTKSETETLSEEEQAARDAEEETARLARLDIIDALEDVPLGETYIEADSVFPKSSDEIYTPPPVEPETSRAGLYGVLSIIGAALAAVGGYTHFTSARLFESAGEAAIYLPSLFMVLGGLLFAVMAMAFIRAIIE